MTGEESKQGKDRSLHAHVRSPWQRNGDSIELKRQLTQVSEAKGTLCEIVRLIPHTLVMLYAVEVRETEKISYNDNIAYSCKSPSFLWTSGMVWSQHMNFFTKHC